jgi:signal peptidase I
MKPTSDRGKAAATVDPSAVPAAAPPAQPAVKDPPRGTVAEWTITILLLLFGTTFLVQAFVIPTGSMEDTLLIGDHLLVDKLAYSTAGSVSKYLLPYENPHDGDIIVFRYPVDITQTFVKRVVGVPGDHIKIIDQQVYRNGKKLTEPYVVHKNPYPDSFRDNFPNSEPNLMLLDRARDMLANNVSGGEVIVPPESFFAMGDNRDNSLDSRYWGFVPRENIIGKPLIIYWSYNASTESLASSSVNNLASHFLDLAEHFFTKTRWDRTFRLIHGYYNYN